jgi:hypothetical protein
MTYVVNESCINCKYIGTGGEAGAADVVTSVADELQDP